MSSLRYTTRRITSLTPSRTQPSPTCLRLGLPLRSMHISAQSSLLPRSATRTSSLLQPTQSKRWNTSAAASTASPVAEVETPDYLSEGELKIFEIIKKELRPLRLEVQDISGGCGSMYALDIVSEQFRGLPVIKQHRLVNSILGDEIKKWHGVQLKTKAP